MLELSKVLERDGKPIVAIPNEAQCPKCKYFITDHPAYLRVSENFRFKGECICERDRLAEEKLKEERWKIANLPTHAIQSFENFERREGTEHMYGAAIRFSRNEGPRVLTIVGGTGAGKTYITAAIARSFLKKGRSVRFEHTKNLLDNLRATFSSRNDEDFESKLHWYKSVGVLIMDDLGVETGTDWEKSQVWDIIDDRIHRQAHLIITTNQTRDDMADKLDHRIASRVFATREDCGVEVVTTTATDYRVG